MQCKLFVVVTIMILSTTLVPGCLDGSSDEDEGGVTGVNATVPSLPKDAMGLWLPNVDGVIDSSGGNLFGEWSDSHKENIKLIDRDGNSKSAVLRVKAVDNAISMAIQSNDFEVSPANIKIELNDRTLVSQVEGNPALNYKSIIDFSQQLPISSNQMQSSSRIDFVIPTAPMNSVATTYTFTSRELVTEVTAFQFFMNSTQANVGLEIMAQGSIWTYEAAFNFDWVFPLIYPLTDVSIERIEVTQAIQTEQNDVRLVEGKDTLVRVYIDSGIFESVDVKVTLRYCILVFCTKSIQKNHTAIQNPNRESFLDTANFQLPSDWVTHPGITEPIPIGLHATIEHMNSYHDTNKNNDKLFHIAWFNQTHDLNIYYLPLTKNGSTPSNSQIEDSFSRFDAISPTTANYVDIDTRFLRASDDYTAGDFKTQGIELLNYIMIFSELTGNIPYPDQFVLLHPSGVPLIDDDGDKLCGTSTPEWAPTSYDIYSYLTISKVSHVCRSKHVVAHEINHNLGPLGGTDTWTWCALWDDVNGNGEIDEDIDICTEYDTASEDWGVGDATWGGHIGPECDAAADDADWYGEFGMDMTIEDLGWTSYFDDSETNLDSLISDETRELMGYCVSEQNPEFGRWISIYRWNILYDLFQDWEVGNPTGRSADNSVEKSRIITLSIGENASGKLHYTYTLDNSAIEPVNTENQVTGERYEVRTFSANNQLLDVASITKNSHELHSLHEGLEIEEQSVVLIVEEKQPVSEIHLFYVNEEGNETLVDAFYNYSKQPEIFVDSLPATIDSREKEIIIGWNSTNMEDQSRLLYQLEYSWGYDIWVPVGIPTKNTSISMDLGTLPGSSQSSFRVRAMNGMATSYGMTNSFILPFQNPNMELVNSQNLNDGKLDQGEVFDFQVQFSDPDWASPNLNSCKARLKNEQSIVWGDGGLTVNRLVTKNVPDQSTTTQGGCTILGHSKIGVSFPNNEISLAKLSPGRYTFEVEYTDEHGGMVSQKFDFVIEINFEQTKSYRETILENYRQNLIQPADDIPDLGLNELQYVMTLRMDTTKNQNFDNHSASQIGEMMLISESRRDELISISGGIEKSNDSKD